jgi:hypothetical protein
LKTTAHAPDAQPDAPHAQLLQHATFVLIQEETSLTTVHVLLVSTILELTNALLAVQAVPLAQVPLLV